MNILPNRDIIFNNRTELTVIDGDDFHFKDYYPHIKDLIRQSINDFGKTKNIKNLLKHLKKFPKIPFFYEQLINEYFRKDDYILAEKYSILFNTKYPNEFASKLNMARVHAYNGDNTKVKNILGPNLALAEAFPKKTTYHMSEIVNFFIFRIDFCLIEDRLENAIETEMKLAELIPNEPAHLQAKARITAYKKAKFQLEDITVELTTERKLTYVEYNLSNKQVKKLEDFYHRMYKLTSPDVNFLVEVQIAIDKNPEVAYFKELICEYHQQFQEDQKYIDAINTLYQYHPDFLIAKIRMAQILISSEQLKTNKASVIDSLMKVFNNALELPKVCPDRKIFLAFEFTYFYYTAMLIWLEKENFAKADSCLKQIEKVPGNENIAKGAKQEIENFVDSLALKNLN